MTAAARSNRAVHDRRLLGGALVLSLALHGAAFAAAHLLGLGEDPAAAPTTTVALVVVAPPAPTAPAIAGPAPEKPLTPAPAREAAPDLPVPPRRPATPPATHQATAAEAVRETRPAAAKTAAKEMPVAASESAALAPALPPALPPAWGLPGLANPAPAYPWRARQNGEQGRVILRVSVDSGGRPTAVAVARTSGYGRLDRAAVAAIRQWRFAPARAGGRDVAGTVEVPVTFRLSDG